MQAALNPGLEVPSQSVSFRTDVHEASHRATREIHRPCMGLRVRSLIFVRPCAHDKVFVNYPTAHVPVDHERESVEHALLFQRMRSKQQCADSVCQSFVKWHDSPASIEQLTQSGFPILRRIARNTTERKVDHRVVFGFTHQTAPQLVSFLRKHKAHLEQVTGVRYSGELGHPFHVVDDDLVILSLDHPFIPEGRFASLLVRDQELAQKLAEGFQKLWSKAMRNLREIDPPWSLSQAKFASDCRRTTGDPECMLLFAAVFAIKIETAILFGYQTVIFWRLRRY